MSILLETNRQTDRDRQSDRQTQTDRQIDRQTDRQTDLGLMYNSTINAIIWKLKPYDNH